MMSITGTKKRAWSSMPQGTASLFLIQIVSTLSFSVLYSTLVLYMKGTLNLPVSTANSIVGVFIALNFALHLLGGFLGGRFLSNRSLFCFGMVAQIIGCFLLSLGGTDFLYYGLAAFLTGSGLNVTCLNCMLTQRFAANDSRRETAFLWNYAGMNIGFFVGYSLSGVFQISQNYQQLFLLSSLGNLVALIICLYCWQQLADRNTSYSKKDKVSQHRSLLIGSITIIALPFILSLIVHYAEWANKLILGLGIVMLGVIVFIASQQQSRDAKNKIIAFAILMVVGTIFWMLYQIGPMGLTVFIEHNVHRHYGSVIIPPQWFQNINTVAIVVGGPLLGIVLVRMRGKGININIPSQFALALLAIGIAFALLPVGIHYANSEGMVSPSWIIASFLLQSIGELLISPIGYAMIGFLAPPSLQGIMMGMWMLNTGVGAVLSSYSSNLMLNAQESTSPLITNADYGHVFLMLGLVAIASSAVLFALAPKLRVLMQEKKVDDFNENQEALVAIK